MLPSVSSYEKRIDSNVDKLKILEWGHGIVLIFLSELYKSCETNKEVKKNIYNF